MCVKRPENNPKASVKTPDSVKTPRETFQMEAGERVGAALHQGSHLQEDVTASSGTKLAGLALVSSHPQRLGDTSETL